VRVPEPHQRALLGARLIPVGDVVAGDVVQLVTERKRLTGVIERVAHQAEIDLVRWFTPRYHRADDETRTRAALVRDETWGVARRAECPRRAGSSPRPVVAVLDAVSRSTFRRAAAQRLADQ
jgi:hypothetical protein